MISLQLTMIITLGSLDFSINLIEDAIWSVESNRCIENCKAGDNGKSIGGLQIQKICFDSVSKKGEKYSQCEDIKFSFVIFRRTIKRFCNDKRLEMILGRKPTEADRLEAYAKCWNGGANWWKAKPNSKKYKNLNRYWIKVQNAMRQKVKESYAKCS